MFSTPMGWRISFPKPEGPVERILVFVSNQESDLFNIKRRVRQIFPCLLMSGLRQQVFEAGVLLCKPALQGTVAHPELSGDSLNVGAPCREAALQNPFDRLGERAAALLLIKRPVQRGSQNVQQLFVVR